MSVMLYSSVTIASTLEAYSRESACAPLPMREITRGGAVVGSVSLIPMSTEGGGDSGSSVAAAIAGGNGGK